MDKTLEYIVRYIYNGRLTEITLYGDSLRDIIEIFEKGTNPVEVELCSITRKGLGPPIGA